MMFCESKSKLNFLIVFTLIYGVIKIVHFSCFAYFILKVIFGELCDDENCVVEYAELSFVLCVFPPLILLVYGALKVMKLNMKSNHVKMFP